MTNDTYNSNGGEFGGSSDYSRPETETYYETTSTSGVDARPGAVESGSAGGERTDAADREVVSSAAKNSQNFVFQNDAKGYENFSGSAPQSMFQYAAPQYTPPRKKRGKVVGLVAGVLCAALVFGVGGFFLGRSGNAVLPSELAGGAQDANDYSAEAQMPQDTGSAEGSFSIEGIHANTTNGNRTPLSVEEIAAQNRDAVVLITAQTQVSSGSSYGNYGGYFFSGGFFDQQPRYSTSLGSGVFITEDGYILTCAHVVDGATNITVTLSDNTTLDATLVGSDTETDIAVLKVEGSNFPYSALGDSDSLVLGETCVAIGNPLGTLTGTVTSGVISGLERTITVEGQSMNLLQHDAAINEGNSGGPLYNEYGEVVGINNAKTNIENVEGIGYAIPINDVKDIIEDLVNVGYVTGRPKLGISTYEISATEAQYYGAPQGVGVTAVETGSGAENAGVQAGDIITACNDIQTLTIDELKDVIDDCEVGQTVKLTIWRSGSTITLNVTLMEDTPEDTAPASYDEEREGLFEIQ